MSKQIKKKFLAQEVISYFDNQIDAVEQSVTQETQAREQAIQTLQVTVDADLSGVESAIAQEVLDRQAGDAALQSQITNLLSNVDPAALDSLSEVVSAFEAADSNLNNAITSLAQSASSALATEQAARIAADSALQDEIDAEELARAAGDNTLQVKIDAEEAARILGDSQTLQAAKDYTDAEIAAIPAVDLTPYETIVNVDSKDAAKLVEAKDYADSKVLEEKGLREAGDSALDGRITTLESQVGQNLQQAITDLQAADAVLDGKISTEKARIDAILDASQADKDSFAEIVQLINSVDLENDNGLASAVQSINSSIAAETAARQAADSSLSSDLSDLDVYAQDIRSDLDSLDVYAQDIRSDLDQEVLDRQAGDLSSLNSAKAYTDAQIAAIPAVDLSGINSSISSLQAADIAIDTRLDALEAVQVPRIVEDEEHVQGSTLSHIMLDYKAEKIFKVCVGRVNVFKGKDYSVSEEGGKTKLTWMGSVAQGGAEAMVSSDEIMVTYSTLDAVSSSSFVNWDLFTTNYTIGADGALSKSGAVTDYGYCPRSSSGLSGDFKLTFEASSENILNGFAVGVSNSLSEVENGANQMIFYFESLYLNVYCQGNVITSAIPSSPGNNVFKLERSNGTINFVLNGSVVSQFIYSGTVYPECRLGGSISKAYIG